MQLVGRCPNPFPRRKEWFTIQNRTRPQQLIVRVTPEEKALILKKMQMFGTKNFSRYARKMLIDGYVINLDLSHFRELAGEVHKVGINVNQIAKTANATGIFYADDMKRTEEMIAEIWRLLKSYLSELLSKSR